MTEWKWLIGVLVLAGAIVTHGAFSRYEIAITGTGNGVIRIDRLTGEVAVSGVLGTVAPWVTPLPRQ